MLKKKYPAGLNVEFPKSLNQLFNGEYEPLYNIDETNIHIKKITMTRIPPTLVKGIFFMFKDLIKYHILRNNYFIW